MFGKKKVKEPMDVNEEMVARLKEDQKATPVMSATGKKKPVIAAEPEEEIQAQPTDEIALMEAKIAAMRKARAEAELKAMHNSDDLDVPPEQPPQQQQQPEIAPDLKAAFDEFQKSYGGLSVPNYNLIEFGILIELIRLRQSQK